MASTGATGAHKRRYYITVKLRPSKSVNATYPKVALNASAKVAANKEPKPFRDIQDVLGV